MRIKKRAARYGLNIKKYFSEHEAYVAEQMDAGCDLKALLALHTRKLQWLQHERLIHLIVVFIFAILFLFLIVLYIALLNLYTLILLSIVLIVLAAYIGHYFILENKVQYWYTLYDEIHSRL